MYLLQVTIEIIKFIRNRAYEQLGFNVYVRLFQLLAQECQKLAFELGLILIEDIKNKYFFQVIYLLQGL